MVKNPPPVTWETQFRSLHWEGPLKESMATHSSTLAWRIPMDRGAWRATVHGVTKSRTGLSDEAQHSIADSRCVQRKPTQHYKTIILQLK